MAGRNQVTLTFAGDASRLDRTFNQVVASAKRFERRVENAFAPDLSRNGSRAASSFGSSFTDALSNIMSRNPLGVLLVAGIAAAGPAIGAAVASAVLLGLGGGVLALGIVSAVRDPAVSGAFGELGDQLSDTFSEFGEPFKKPLIRAAQTFSDALERMEPALLRIGEAAAPIVDLLAPALADLVEKSLPGIEKAVNASVPLFEKLAEHAPQLGESISRFFTILADNEELITSTFDMLLKIAEKALPALAIALVFLSSMFQTTFRVVRFFVNWIVGGWRLVGRVTRWLTDRIRDGFAAWRGVLNRVVGWVRNTISGIRERFGNLIGFIRGLPGRVRSAASGLFNGVRDAFRSAINWIIDRWNSLSFTLPGFRVGPVSIGGGTLSTPDIPRLHTGGIVPGRRGEEVMALLRAGERVIPQGGSDRTVIEIRSGGSRLGDLLVEVLSREVRVRGGNVQVVLGRG